MNRVLRVGATALALVALVLVLRPCRPARVPATPAVDLPPPSLPAARPAPAPPREVAKGSAPDPERLRPFLERLGRARLLRDAKGLARLRAAYPTVFESDTGWIVERLADELTVAAGAAEAVQAFRLRPVAELSRALAGPVHSFLKDVLIEALASIGGDGAVVALLSALRSDAEPSVRARAALAVGRFEGMESYHALVAALRDPSPAVRSAASEALGRMKSQEAVAILLAAVAGEPEPEVQASLASGAYAAGGETAREPVIRALQASAQAAAAVTRRVRLENDARYRQAYPARFFEPGGGADVPLDAASRRIGITVELAPGMKPADVAGPVFGAAPFDRYRGVFHLRLASDFPAPRAYDSYGNPMGDLAWGEGDGTVFLRFREPDDFPESVLGVTRGCEAQVMPVSLLHELGHALARLGDEYAGGSSDDRVNLSRQAQVPWAPLVAGGHLPAPPRRDGSFFIPSEECHLGNRPGAARYCPVCQLEIHARICSLSGAPLPW